MSISLKEITAENWVEAIKLKVKKEQENFVASNAISLAQSKFQPYLECHGLYLDDEMVGFSATGKNPEDGTIWIARFMVGEQFQGKGYASILLKSMLAKIDQQNVPVYLYTNKERNVSIYKRFNFKIVEETIIPKTDVPFWAMLRDKSG